MFQRLYHAVMSSIRAKLLLVILAVGLLPILPMVWYGIYVVREVLQDYTLTEQQHYVHTLALDIESFLSGVHGDVLFMSQTVEIEELILAQDEDEYAHAIYNLEQEFLAFSQVRGIYYQVRFVDTQGMEIVRVDSDGEQAFIVPADQLQDKSDCYYFKDSIDLPQGDVMVSLLDLNVEHGEIEQPYKPVIRYAATVWVDGRSVGLVVLNVFADKFLNPLGEQASPSETVLLVDEEGYYLYHSQDESKCWGRDLGSGITLEQDYPGLLGELFSSGYAHEDFEHQSQRVGDELLSYTMLAPAGTAGDFRWALISVRPMGVVFAPLVRLQWLILGMFSSTLVLVFVLGQWSSSRLVRPVRRLEALAVRMGKGDLDTKITVGEQPHPDEIGVLAQSLDQARLALLQARQDLEFQVASATRRAVDLRAASQVAGAAVAILNPQELLNNVVNLISERFNFYHTGVFLLDETGMWAELQAASSEGGQRMLGRGHRLRIGEQGIVGYVAATGEPRIALDVGADAVHFVNPDLPDTRSEMALPLQSRNHVLGVLDVQSVEAEAFTGEDVATLQILADQVAMAISNARLFQDAQENLVALQRARGDYTFHAWIELARALEGGGYRYYQKALLPARDIWRSEMALAVKEGRLVRLPERPDTVAIPLRDRDQIIGVIDARKPEGAEVWTEDEIALLETLARQLEIALGSARLYQDTRIREAREQMVRRITDSMRRSLEVDVVAQRASQELGEALGAGTVTVRLGTLESLLAQANQTEDES